MTKKERKKRMKVAAGNAEQFARYARFAMRRAARDGRGTAEQIEEVAYELLKVAGLVREADAKNAAHNRYSEIGAAPDGGEGKPHAVH